MAPSFRRWATKATDEWKEEIVYFDGKAGPRRRPVFPAGAAARIGLGEDPRQVCGRG